MPEDRNNKVSCQNYRCEIEVALELISGKWKALILWELGQNHIIRFNAFRRIIPGITQKMLTQQLRQLEDHHLVKRTIYNQVPPVVEYSLTEEGQNLIPILETLDQFGKAYVKNHKD